MANTLKKVVLLATITVLSSNRFPLWAEEEGEGALDPEVVAQYAEVEDIAKELAGHRWDHNGPHPLHSKKSHKHGHHHGHHHGHAHQDSQNEMEMGEPEMGEAEGEASEAQGEE